MPQKFIESFLREKTTAWSHARTHLTPVYANYFGDPLSQHAWQFMPIDTVREAVEDVKLFDGKASVVTCQRVKKVDMRTRYRLVDVGGNWKIIGIDRACFCCRGTGKADGSPCQKCNEVGWCDSTA